MELTKIRVKTIGYYHRDSEMKTTPGLLPKTLNLACLTPIENKEDFPNMNIEVIDSGAGELMMESLLDYIRQTNCLQDEKPDFVTNKQLLVALTRIGPLDIYAFKWNGATYLLKFSEDETVQQSYGAVFEHFCTKTYKDEPINIDEPVRKAVMLAEIPRGNGAFHRVLYSGQIDAINDEVHCMHYELKVLSGGLGEHFWKKKSCMFYWQAVFGDAPILIIGSRTGSHHDKRTQEPNCWAQYALYKTEVLTPDAMPLMAATIEKRLKKVLMKPASKWTPSEGEENVCYFLDLVEEYVKNNGDCFVFNRSDENPDWIVKEDKESVAEFRKVVHHYLAR